MIPESRGTTAAQLTMMHVEAEAEAMPDVRTKQVGGAHYKDHAIQPWDIIDEYKLDFYEGCALKYLLRSKDPAKRIEDLRKAIHCIEKRIQVMAVNGATIG